MQGFGACYISMLLFVGHVSGSSSLSNKQLWDEVTFPLLCGLERLDLLSLMGRGAEMLRSVSPVRQRKHSPVILLRVRTADAN